MERLVLAALIAFVSALGSTWLTRRLALRLGVVDRPDGVRKLHRAPIPLLGGLGVCAAWLAGMAGAACLGSPSGLDPAALWQRISAAHGLGPAFLLAVALIMAVGVVDDVLVLRARWKLAGQVVGAAVLVAGGLAVRRVWLFGHAVDFAPPVGIAFTLVWLVGSMNALNMIDGMDGLASTVGILTCLPLAAMAWVAHYPGLALLTVALAGALAGFLRFNWPPARIFLGDSGSMLIGLVVGVAAIKGSFKAPATAALAAPVAALTVPIFDGVAAVVRRRLTGRVLAAPDRGHIHHCLQRRGWSNRRVVAVIGGLCAATGLAALASLYLRSEPVALLTSLVVVVGCVATGVFGHIEYRLLLGKPAVLWVVLRGGWRLKAPALSLACWQVRRCRSFEDAWRVLVEAADQLGWRRLELHVSGPAAVFDARYEAPEATGHAPDAWHAVVALSGDGRALGQLSVSGFQRPGSVLPGFVGLAMVARAVAALCRRLQPGTATVLPLPAAESPSTAAVAKRLSA